ncbi:uncharacterized protein LACBIDRAFT_312171 [Laccaria bicolor S238N-H82]|uniref:Predicted protein n=1 Tax=Laccaria bicolor (strain S238N-H82 / ATCC MYA-4686) TaxID=486041 RepID=B0DVN5_LACBS|nr:uncharacterized protein LACBIDRAFT_312171 [Laccaria bicolor S238N-H82]EDR01333.1 predicted protein [Laccaria bicolor S238N-H82]|eukprot:XP_001888040.1 predicted protein [Laccaria bicolor S238N-H82]
MKLSKVEPCGALCFKLQDFDSEEKNLLESSPWSNPDDITMFEGILKLTPDTIPCGLAIICGKTCSEKTQVTILPVQANSSSQNSPDHHCTQQFLNLPKSSTLPAQRSMPRSLQWSSCRASARECDPELCVKCDARGRHKKKKCLNNYDIQKGRFQVPLLDQIPIEAT